MKNVLVPLAEGFEECEFIGIVDVLRRSGLNVMIAGLQGRGGVRGSNNVEIVAEVGLEEIEVENLDAIVLPGGLEGMQNLSRSQKIIDIIKKLHSKDRLIGAICSSPVVLDKAGVLSREFTCYPGFEKGLKGNRVEGAVVERGNIITSAGPATAILFGLSIVRRLCGGKVYQDLYNGLLLPLAKAA